MNIQGLIHKVDEVNILLNDNDIDVLCINETWLKSDNDDSEIEIDGYNAYRLDRQNGKIRGGVLCYVKNTILSKQNDDLYDNDIEGIFIEINLTNTKPILVGSIYRPPDCTVDFLDNLDDIFKKCNNLYDDVYILGDFNLDQVKAGNLKKVTRLANNSNMKQIITDYTRITETSKTKIDLIFVSKPELIISSGVHSIGLSDHSLTYAVRKCNKIKLPPKIVKSRCFKNFNEVDYIDTIRNINWDRICNLDDVNVALNEWQSSFNAACDKHAPFKEKRVKGCLPEWINSDFLRLSKDRDYYFSKAHKTNNDEDWKKAKSLRNKVNNMKYALKKSYCNKAISDNINNSKNLWKTIKKIIPNKTSSMPSAVVKKDGNYSGDKKDTANEFNDFFTSIGNELGSKFDNNNSDNVCSCNSVCSHQNDSVNKFTFKPISYEFVLKQICKMPNCKSSGLDPFNVKLLKLAAPFISKCLAHICNLSLNGSTFPDAWKKAKVTPIFKSGDKTNVSNYRPISVLPIVSKIIERAVHDQLYEYMSNVGLLSNCQSGFRPNHSTSTTLLDVQDYILKNMDTGYATGVLFIDLKKAFDTVNHDILIRKLEQYGINGNELLWFKSYLNNRVQTVNVDSTLSDFRSINIGIPQGSILGPLLFIIFVNCLPYAVSDCKTVMYADDTSLMCKSKNKLDLKSQMESCLSKIAEWFKVNKLTLNVDKTKFMVFGTQKMLEKFNDVNLAYHNSDIERVDEFKYLGVKLDSKLSWSAHVDYVSKTISKRTGIIRRIKYFLPYETTVMLSNALVIPHFDYGSLVWSNFGVEYHNRLQVLHNNLARIILSADIMTPTNDLMNMLQWVKLNKRWHNTLLITVFKCLKNECPSYLSSQFEFVHDNHTYKTRNHTSNTLIVPKFKSNSGLRTFHVRAAYAWNSLPPTLRGQMEDMTLGQFQSKIKEI